MLLSEVTAVADSSSIKSDNKLSITSSQNLFLNLLYIKMLIQYQKLKAIKA